VLLYILLANIQTSKMPNKAMQGMARGSHGRGSVGEDIELRCTADRISDVPIKADHTIDGTAVAEMPVTSGVVDALMRLCFIVLSNAIR
jgi:hypothetical protein